MTNAKKEQLFDLIDQYGCYQYLLGKAYENGDSETKLRYLTKIKEAVLALRDEFGIEMTELTYL